MIKLALSIDGEPVAEPNFIKIAASLKAYGANGRFLTLWRTGDTLIMRCDGHFTLYGEDFDPEETREFLSVAGGKSLACSESAAKRLGLEYRVLSIMKSERGLKNPSVNQNPSPTEVYDILALGQDGDITLPEKEAFTADLSHRIRHGTAAAFVYKSAACAAPYITDCGTLICGVCAGNARGLGFAGICLSHAAAVCPKPVFLLCDPALSGYYEKFGFSQCGRNALCEL